MTAKDLYQFAEENDIGIYDRKLKNRKALSIMTEDGSCHIAADESRMEDEVDRRSVLAHEIGHCMTGAFYCEAAPIDYRGACEVRADKWAIKKLIPKDELEKAVREGKREVWELAEHFGVSEDLIRKAVYLYRLGRTTA